MINVLTTIWVLIGIIAGAIILFATGIVAVSLIVALIAGIIKGVKK